MPTVYSPPVSTYIALATVTLDSPSNSVTFSSIPPGYRDYIVVAVRSLTSGSNSEKFYLNGDTTNNNYSRVAMFGNGSNPIGYSGLNSSTVSLYTTPVQTTYHLMDGSVTDKHKTFMYRADSAANYTLAGVHRWTSSDAVISIRLEAENNTYAIGSTFSLFGIEA